MAKWTVEIPVNGVEILQVEADSEEEARIKAWWTEHTKDRVVDLERVGGCDYGCDSICAYHRKTWVTRAK